MSKSHKFISICVVTMLFCFVTITYTTILCRNSIKFIDEKSSIEYYDIVMTYQALSNKKITNFDKSAEHHILVLGNSITKHPIKESIGWNSDWGMAASREENDFCHQLQNMLRDCNEKTDITPVNAAFWERDYALIDSISVVCGGGMTQLSSGLEKM